MRSFRCTFGPLTQTDFVWPLPPADVQPRGVLLSDMVPHAELRTEPDASPIPPPLQPLGSVDDQPGELVWPPPAADLEACSVVRLSEADDDDGQPLGVRIEDFRIHSSDTDTPAEQQEEEEDTPTAELSLPPAVLARLRARRDGEELPQPPSPLLSDERASEPAYEAAYEDEDEPIEEEPAPVYPIPPPIVEGVPEPPAALRGTRLMWAAVLLALSGLAIGYSEFRTGRRQAMEVVRASETPPAAETPSAPEEPIVTFERAPVPSEPEPVAAPEPEPERPATPRTVEPSRRPEPEPEPEPQPRVVMRAASATPPRPVSPAMAPPPAAAPATTSMPAATPAPTPTLAIDTPRTPIAEPVLHTAALESTADAVAMAADEEHIESTLTRFRTAYSKLDARAAREVWPTVDVEALDRAFRGLKSQDLRFDRCDLTVDGSRARAACRGSSVYVPRIGNQSPKATAREWTFELKKANERWTIASARSS